MVMNDPGLKSWIESANDPMTDFPIQNLPLGRFLRREIDDVVRGGVAIGDQVLDLLECERANLVPAGSGRLPMSAVRVSALRQILIDLLREDGTVLQNYRKSRECAVDPIVPQSAVEMQLPAEIGDYTDFYASIFHATNIGRMFRPENPLLPNYKWIPIGYHGRASSVVVSGSPIYRPQGQLKDDSAECPQFGPTRVLDFEVELGLLLGTGNERGTTIGIAQAESHMLGLCLINDWSARDIQSWEYQPLGPFLSKSFATTMSPWIVTMDALEPFRVPVFERPAGDPQPLAHLDSALNRSRGGFNITLEAFLRTERMRADNLAGFRLSRSNAGSLYWTFAQMLTHHASNGCNLRPGDLLASGTVSGPTDESVGSLIERTQRGTRPISLPNGEVRRFLLDGDEIIIRGYCEGENARRIGFGECRGVVFPGRS